MTAKHRNKNNASSEKSPSSIQDDVAKPSPKTPKASKVDSLPASAPGSGPGGWTKIVSAVCYIALVAAAGFVAFHLQHVLQEVNQVTVRNEQSLQRNAEMAERMESVLQQVGSLKTSVEALEAGLASARAEREATARALRRGEEETRRVEEAVHRLQTEILRDLSAGIGEVKEARERDFSSLELTLEERLAELSRSIGASVDEFAEAQGEVRAQLGQLQARVEQVNGPAGTEERLAEVASSVAELRVAGEASRDAAASLGQQIVAVGAQLQTRNQEVASLAEELEEVRALVQSTTAVLRASVASAEAGVQAASTQAATLVTGLGQATEGLQSLERSLRGEVARAEKKEEELELRLKAAEESGVTMADAAAEQASRLEAVLSGYDSQESLLAAQGKASDQAGQAAEAVAERLEELRSDVAALGSSHAELASRDSIQTKLLQGLEERLAEVQELGRTLDGLVSRAREAEEEKLAVGELRRALAELTASVDGLVQGEGRDIPPTLPPEPLEEEAERPF